MQPNLYYVYAIHVCLLYFYGQFSTDSDISLSQGPVSSSDITTREKLTRPVIRMYHRHPGNELPEAGDLCKVGLLTHFARALILRYIFDMHKVYKNNRQAELHSCQYRHV